MKIDTNTQPETPAPRPYDGNVTFRGFGERAERKHRQIIAQIECCETIAEVEATLIEESLILDALFLDFPEYHQAVTQAADDHKAILQAGAASVSNAGAPAPIPATAQTETSKTKETTMFAIDTGNEGGSRGPWMSWTSNGSAMKGFPPKSWVLRGKDQNDEKFENVIPAFENGCVMDLDSLQLGWMKDGPTGQAPEKRWNPSVSQATPRPDESKKQSGAYAWSAALSVRCAIGGGEAATWEQASFGAYDAFSKLAKQIQAEWGEKSQNGNLLPLVKQTGVETQQLKSGASNKPVLQVVDWVERPDCLKDDAPAIATQAATEQQQPAPAQPPQPQGNAAAVSSAGGF